MIKSLIESGHVPYLFAVLLHGELCRLYSLQLIAEVTFRFGGNLGHLLKVDIVFAHLLQGWFDAVWKGQKGVRLCNQRERETIDVQFATKIVHLNGQLIDDKVLLADGKFKVIFTILQFSHSTVVVLQDLFQFVCSEVWVREKETD